jgi:adenylate cyclase
VRFRVPIHSSVAGQVALTGKPMRVEAPYEHPLFNPAVDKVTGFLTRSILSLPVFDSSGAVFAVAQLLNRIDGEPFDDADEQRFTDFLASISVILESWWHMTRLEAARQWEESETLPAAPAG